MTSHDQRARLGALMDILVAKQPQIHYDEFRPMRTHSIHTERELLTALNSPSGVTMDCSEAVTLLCRLAGLKDPNGLNYDGRGFTGTLLKHLPHYTNPKHANVGALVVFGPGMGEHVAMVRHPGSDPVLFSHGSEAGPIFIPLSSEARAHHAPVTFLSIANL